MRRSMKWLVLGILASAALGSESARSWIALGRVEPQESTSGIYVSGAALGFHDGLAGSVVPALPDGTPWTGLTIELWSRQDDAERRVLPVVTKVELGSGDSLRALIPVATERGWIVDFRGIVFPETGNVERGTSLVIATADRVQVDDFDLFFTPAVSPRPLEGGGEANRLPPLAMSAAEPSAVSSLVRGHRDRIAVAVTNSDPARALTALDVSIVVSEPEDIAIERVLLTDPQARFAALTSARIEESGQTSAGFAIRGFPSLAPRSAHELVVIFSRPLASRSVRVGSLAHHAE
jgi:hypothetical protein